MLKVKFFSIEVEIVYSVPMIIDQLSNYRDFTSQECAVADYIRTNPKELLNVSIHDLAILTYTSAGTILRMCKKLGYKGFTDFKYQFASEYQAIVFTEAHNDFDLFSDSTTIDEMMDRLPLSFFRSVEQTMSNLDKKQIQRILKKLKDADEIIFDGSNISYKLADIIAFKFTEIGFSSRAFSGLSWSHLTTLIETNKKVIAILITFSGENASLIEDAKILKDLDIPYIVVTTNAKSSLLEHADEFIQIFYSQVDYLSTSRFITIVHAIFDNFMALAIHYEKNFYRQHQTMIKQNFELKSEAMKIKNDSTD